MLLKGIWDNAHPSEVEIRFDVVSIVIAKDETQIEYFPDAF